MPTTFDIARYGQVFTPPEIVARMLVLRRNHGRALDPACGDGAFSSRIPGCVAIEMDPAHCPPGALNLDFFAYPEAEKFATIIGNPPYVKARDILPETALRLVSSLLNGHANLYLHFIEKCVRHLAPGGELILITPRDFLKATGAGQLNTWLSDQGTITDFEDLGDARIFDGATPNCAIWRFEKGNASHRLTDVRRMALSVSHHEKYDGSGYPKGLAGTKIPLFGRIVAVADVFDALTSERPYKRARELDAACKFLEDGRGAHFDPLCVEAFLACWEEVLEIRQRFQDEDVPAI